jgi:hypothetical protein
MKQAVIIAIVEPLSFSLERSLSWALTTALRKQKRFSLVGSQASDLGQLVGLLPILQPIRATLTTHSAFILLTRCMLDSTSTLTLKNSETCALIDAEGNAVGKVLTNPIAAAEVPSFVLLAPALEAAISSEIEALRTYLADMTYQLWRAEPINWTTHALHLASTGQFLAANEIAGSGLVTGILVTKNISVTIAAGTKPRSIAYRRWRGAGTVSNMIRGDSSASYCTLGGGSSHGGDIGSGTQSDAGGGDTGGNSYADGGGSAGGDGGTGESSGGGTDGSPGGGK